MFEVVADEKLERVTKYLVKADDSHQAEEVINDPSGEFMIIESETLKSIKTIKSVNVALQSDYCAMYGVYLFNPHSDESNAIFKLIKLPYNVDPNKEEVINAIASQLGIDPIGDDCVMDIFEVEFDPIKINL